MSGENELEVMMPSGGGGSSSAAGSTPGNLSSRSNANNNANANAASAAAASEQFHMAQRRSGSSSTVRNRKTLSHILRNLEMIPRSGVLRTVTGVTGFVLLFIALFQGLVMGGILLICLGAVVLTWALIHWMLLQDVGPSEMTLVADAIKEGSDSFFTRVYGTIFKLSMPTALLLFVVFAVREPATGQESINQLGLAFMTAGSFLLGALCSAAAGYIGLWTSVRANVRVSAAAARSYHGAIQLALRAGAIAALVVVLLVVLGISLLFIAFCAVYEGVEGEPGAVPFVRLPILLVGFGFGGSFVAIFAQLGGGIFTKAADVGADLVGKVEQDIPEDDPRNPAAVADLVGDNVGDCSARGADLFESIAGEIIAAMVLGGTLAGSCGMSAGEAKGFVLFPLVVHAFDLVVSSIGVLSVSDKGDAVVTSYKSLEDPLKILMRGYVVSLAAGTVGFFMATRYLLYTEAAPTAWFNYFLCGVVGMVSAYLQVLVTQYYTDLDHYPVKSIAAASAAGPATNIIAGLGVGLESVMYPTLIISVSILSSYWLGRTSGLEDSTGEPVGGLFGTAVATMGMLSTAVYVLAQDIFGPITDNAGGIVEMSGQPESVREVTDRLDAAGNSTKATTKGFAVGSAALACFLLFSAFLDEVSAFSGLTFDVVDIAQPEVFVGGFLGAAMVFKFTALAMQAVGSTAQVVVEEVRRQFRDRPGIMEGTEKPDYAACVDIVSKAALQKMIQPGLLATIMPIAVGLFFRAVGSYTGDRLLGAKALAAMLMFVTVTGIMMALFLNNAGGAWDNTKKLVELQKQKGTDLHHAAVAGDMVGDPCKDTAGPSLHVLIKLVSTVTLVLAPIFVGQP